MLSKLIKNKWDKLSHGKRGKWRNAWQEVGHKLISVLPRIVQCPFLRFQLIMCLINYPSVHDTITQALSCDACWPMRSYEY